MQISFICSQFIFMDNFLCNNYADGYSQVDTIIGKDW